VLSSFKYLDFFTGGHALEIMHGLGFTQMTASDVARLLPVGLSFYTFQSIAYVMDVYRGEIPPQRKLLDFLLFVSFFPQLVAGPIQRAGFLASQLATPRIFDARIARSAIVLVLWGFFKKLVIADNAALVANKVFSVADPSWPVLWAGVFAFSIQIYADFSAYTDIARGSARLLGFELAPNFDHPYLSASPPEFWRRWHISLSTWFRDYVYIPLGGGRRSEGRVIANVLLTFLLSGLWHGASWNFLLWGGYHGLLLVLWRAWEKAPERWRPQRFPRWPQVILTFLLINLGWLMFRETNLTMLIHELGLNPFAATRVDWQSGLYLVCLVCTYAWPLAVHAAVDRWLERHHTEAQAEFFPGGKWSVLQSGLATLLLVGIILLGSMTSADFIYFQF
jgi:D-alanyl-lipoteichoic acid acyltransferase DltB (MBOAT superfamily)